MKIGQSMCNRSILNVTKFQHHTASISGVRGKRLVGGGKFTPPPPPPCRIGLIKQIRHSPNDIFNIRCSTGLKLLTCLRLGLSHLREHKFNHNFKNTLNPLCPCSLESESTSHFFLHCHNFVEQRNNLKNEL